MTPSEKPQCFVCGADLADCEGHSVAEFQAAVAAGLAQPDELDEFIEQEMRDPEFAAAWARAEARAKAERDRVVPVAEGPEGASRQDQIVADWTAGMRQVDIAAKYGVSQGYVSKICSAGTSPAAVRAEIRRLREAVAEYFLNHDQPQKDRDRALFDAFANPVALARASHAKDGAS